MDIVYDEQLAVLGDLVSVEQAEELLEWMQRHPGGALDLAACTHIHAASLQVLMAAGLAVSAWPRDAELTSWLASALPQ